LRRRSPSDWRSIARKEKAVSYYLEAGQEAIARGTMTEALAHLRKGLDIVTRLPDGAARQEQELDLQIALGHALETTKGLADVETGEVYVRARRLCEELKRPEQLGLVLYGQYLSHCPWRAGAGGTSCQGAASPA
jgi:predicted ATPase